MYNEKYLKAKVKSKNGKLNTHFCNNKIPKEGAYFFFCLSVIFRTGNNYYRQVFLEECKHVFEEEKMSECFTDDIGIFSDDSDKEDSDEENFYFYISILFLLFIIFLYLFIKY